MHHKVSIDFIRLLAAFMVVAVHTYPFASINADFDFLFTLVFCRIAVPIFLMITGYYVIQKALKNVSYLIQYTKKIAIIYGIAILLYLPINLYNHTFASMNLYNILQMIFIDGTFYHLWYFPALILGIWILYWLIKKWKEPYISIIVILLYLIGLFGDSYYGLIANTGFYKIYQFIFSVFSYTRNGLFYVPIFLYIGYLFTKVKWHYKPKCTLLLWIISIIFMEIEGYFLNVYGLQRHTSMYAMLIPTCVLLFALILPYKENKNVKIRTMATIIYIIHPMCIIGIRGIVKILNLEHQILDHNFLQYIFTLLLSIVISYVLVLFDQKVKKKSA